MELLPRAVTELGIKRGVFQVNLKKTNVCLLRLLWNIIKMAMRRLHRYSLPYIQIQRQKSIRPYFWQQTKTWPLWFDWEMVIDINWEWHWHQNLEEFGFENWIKMFSHSSLGITKSVLHLAVGDSAAVHTGSFSWKCKIWIHDNDASDDSTDSHFWLQARKFSRKAVTTCDGNHFLATIFSPWLCSPRTAQGMKI